MEEMISRSPWDVTGSHEAYLPIRVFVKHTMFRASNQLKELKDHTSRRNVIDIFRPIRNKMLTNLNIPSSSSLNRLTLLDR